MLDRGNHTAGTAQLWPWLYATVIVGCVYLLGVARSRQLVAPRWLGVVGALLALRLISYAPASNAGVYLHAVAQAAVYVLLPLVVFNLPRLRFAVLRRAILLPLVVILAGSLVGIFRHSNPFSYGDVLGSALGHRNFASVFLAASLPLLLTWGRAPGTILATVSVYVILVNRTRSAWLMLAVYAVGIAVVFVLCRTPRIARVGRRFVVGFVVALACLVVVPTGLRWSTPSPHLKSLTTMASLEESSGRDQIWLVSLSMIRRHPFRGVGGGNYAVHFDEHIVEARADRKVTGTVVGMNDYLQEAAECGVLGGVAMALVVLGGAVLVLLRAKKKRKWSLAILGLGPLALAADALVDYPLGRVETTLLFFVPVALLLRALRVEVVRVSHRLVVASSVAASALFTFLTSRQALSRYALAEYRATNDFSAYERHYRAWPWRREVDDLLVVRTYLKNAHREEAAEYARERLQNWPNAPTSRLALALVYEDAEDTQAAASVYREIFAGTGQCHAEVASAYERFARAFPDRRLSPAELPRCLGEGAAPQHARVPADVAWKQTQTFLAEWRGEPVFAANWSGRYRPWVWHAGEAIPVIAPSLVSDDVDFFSPIPLSDDELILSGSSNGREDRFDLYLYAREGKLSNLTSSPEANHGHVCVLPSARLISWREKQTQRFAMVTSNGKLEARGSTPKYFDGCEWLDARSLLAFARTKTGYELSRCTLDGRVDVRADVRCEALPALASADDVVQLFRTPGDAIGVIARLKGMAFRRAYLVSSTGSELTPPPGVPDVEGDVLGVEGSRPRVGLHARYSLGATPAGGAGIVHTFQRIGHEVYAIRSDASAAKFLALETEHGFARIAPKAEPSPTAKPREPLEVWLRTPSGRRIQAFYFGPLDPSRVIVWWHGGPKENVSPRYNPYFDSFEEAGFGVLAVNYPGSTGRGATFEELFSAPGALLDTADAVLGYLRENGVRTIVSWSVSTGEVFQSLILDARRSVSAIVDEGGGSVRLLRARADAQGVPFFSIHGRFDANFDPSAKNDFVFEGGHALLHLEDFTAMERAVRPFLSSAPALAEGKGTGMSPAGSTSLVLDAGHEGNASDPNEVRGLREASLTFELVNDISEECALEPAPRPTRTGSATLISKSDALGRRANTMRTADAPSVSVHFNASEPGTRSENLASVFLPSPPDPREVETAARLLDGLSDAGLKPKLSYPELSTVARPVAPGIFVRGGLAVLGGTSPRCRFLVEAAYYDDPAEHERLSKRILTSDGAHERPRIREIARALCPAMRDVATCAKASQPP